MLRKLARRATGIQYASKFVIIALFLVREGDGCRARESSDVHAAQRHSMHMAANSEVFLSQSPHDDLKCFQISLVGVSGRLAARE